MITIDNNFLNVLFEKQYISDKNLNLLLKSNTYNKTLFKLADCKRKEYYSNFIYIRGLIEFTNYCKNDCFYCGIRKSNTMLTRYRLTENDILRCCEKGYKLGLKTFVLQGGEDVFFTDDVICDIICKIRKNFKDCVITLSMGERPKESYEKLFKAGARRYLLRQETADINHYKKLHPLNMSLENRKKCLLNLKEIGFSVGAGFLVGSPFQTLENIIGDLKFLQKLKPDMIGIGPFISQKNTPFANFKGGSIDLTLKLLAILRLMFPHALMPATTALFSINANILKKALSVGTNVLMTNVTPKKYQNFYTIYDDKYKRKEKTLKNLKKNIYLAGYKFKVSKGNVNNIKL